MIISAMYQTSRFACIFIVLAHRHNRPRVDISLRSNYALTPLSCALSGKGTNTIVLVIVWPDHAQTTTYHNREKHANRNTTNTVSPILNDDTCTYNIPPHVHLSTSHFWYVCEYTQMQWFVLKAACGCLYGLSKIGMI